MAQRVSFNSGIARGLFFEKVLDYYKIGSWKKLSMNFNISRANLSRYRRGELTLPEMIYKKLTSKFPNRDLIYFEKNISYLNDNWGRVKGGNITYLKYRHIFDEGRKRGLKKFKERSPKFNINLPLSKELAYLVGLFIGDGFTNKYGKYYLTQFVGHFFHEFDYYKNTISKILKDLFNLSPKIKKDRKSNALRVNLYSKDLFLLFTKRFGIKAGRKSSEVLIPQEILNSYDDIVLSCIAGLYDAEGSLYFDRRTIYKKPYPIMEFHIHNSNLIKQISRIFDKLSIRHYVRDNFSRIYIYGPKEVDFFLKKVNLLNPKITKKSVF